jgi:hypothetical protein
MDYTHSTVLLYTYSFVLATPLFYLNLFKSSLQHTSLLKTITYFQSDFFKVPIPFFHIFTNTQKLSLPAMNYLNCLTIRYTLAISTLAEQG